MAHDVFKFLGGGDDLVHLSAKESEVLRHLVIGGEMYGLQIVDASGGSVGRGTVYVTLARLQDKGFVDTRQEAQPPGASGLPRRLYCINGVGETALRRHELAAQVLSGKGLTT